MQEERYSLMILPRCSDGSILLQTWITDQGRITDGFGSFYQVGNNPDQIAQKVLVQNFSLKAKLTEAAHLEYYINKPTGLVYLRVTVYFADITKDLPLQEQMHWFSSSTIPYNQIQESTTKWLPTILQSNKLLVATIKVDQPGSHVDAKVTEFSLS